MSGNSILNNARYSSNNTDEWYTTYETIAAEVSHYEEQFRGKTVLCNCDDPFESNFCYYFLKNFNKLRLKKLICTSFSGSKVGQIKNNLGLDSKVLLDLEKKYHPGSSYILSVVSVPGTAGELTSDDVIAEVLKQENTIRKLSGSGDFRSEECVKYLQECDICCTNPPFSLFSELFSLLMRYKKKFLLIGNQNAITYKEVFPYIKEEKVWVGYKFGDMSFRVPDDTPPRKTRFWIDEKGQKWRSLGNAMWLTNLDSPMRHAFLDLTHHYSPEAYPKYDNYDAINVKKVSDIPVDYSGIMGVPITYLKYHNGLQFEIVGEANHGSDNEFDLFKPKIDGKELFKRILIRKKSAIEMPKKFRILDLFCGAGGLSWGMHKNPAFSTVVALDFDEKAAETFKRNMPTTEVVVGDITDSAVKNKIISLSQENKVNMIVGGPPCQGYSMKGKKLGLKDPRNFLFREYLDLVKQLQPDVFLIENVKGLLISSNGWFKNEIIQSIEDLGYIVRYGVMNAADYGVPQARERAIFICCKHGAIELPTPIKGKRVTVRDAISDLSYLESGEGSFEQNYITKPSSDYQMERREGSDVLYNHKASNHKQIAIDKLKMIPPEQGKECLPTHLLGNQKFKTTWGRLKWDDVSPTIDTRFDASSNGTNNHPYLNRAITPREAARIQSFDDCFVFLGSKVYIRKQIGNAVPPLLAKAIADQIEKNYPCEQCEDLNKDD